MIATAPFGRTGHESSRAIFGAAALGNVSQADADRTFELLLAHGVNHIDTAASYGDSELRVAPWLRREPGRFFVATKTGDREYKAAKESILRSLERLGVDHVDLIQLHNLVDVIEWETALREGGALEAAIEARDEGLVRFIGVTGHGLSVAAMHRRSLERFPFDSVLLPYNISQLRDPVYAEHFEALAQGVRRARRRAADDQEHRARAVGRAAADRLHLVRAAHRPGRHRDRGPLGARAAGGLPQHRRRRESAPARPCGGGADRSRSAVGGRGRGARERRSHTPLFV